MKNFRKTLLLLCLAISVLSCAPTTQIRKSWVDPSMKNTKIEPFTKVLVWVTAKQESGRRAAEDQLVADLRKGMGVQSYTYLTPADTSKKEIVEKLIKDGFDGAITMHVKAVVQTKTKTNPGTSYESWASYGGAYGYGYGYSYSYTVDMSADISTPNVDVNSVKDYIIETNIYSLREKKLVWSGMTASLSARKVEPAMTGIVNAIKKELNKKGIIKN